MNVALSVIVFWLGLCVGSFLNVCIWRLPRRESLVFSRSHCPKCGMRLKAFDNIPILSFMLLGGKCRNCKESISWRYPLVELLTAIVFLVSFWHFGWGWELASKLVLLTSLIVIFFIDLEHKMIPDVISLPGVGLGVVLSFLVETITFWQSLIGLLVGGISLYLIAMLGDFLFKKESMGGGDIKMAAMLGAFLGWEKLLVSFSFAVLLGTVAGIIMMLSSRKARESRVIPFGPFLSLGAFISVFWGEQLIGVYVSGFLH